MGRGGPAIVIILSVVSLAGIGAFIDYTTGSHIAPREDETPLALIGLGALAVLILLVLAGGARGGKTVVKVGV
jgi:hypothetical protein